MYDVMEYMVAPIVKKEHKKRKYSDIDLICRTLPKYYIQYLIVNHMGTFNRKWNRFSKPDLNKIKYIMNTSENPSYSSFIPMNYNMKYLPIRKDLNIFHLPLERYLEGEKLNKSDKKNLKKGVLVYYWRTNGINTNGITQTHYYTMKRDARTLCRGVIVKSNALYGNALSLLQIRPQNDLWSKYKWVNNPNDNKYLWTKILGVKKQISGIPSTHTFGAQRIDWESDGQNPNAGTYWEQMCSVDVIPLENLITNTYETLENGDRLFKKDTIS